MKTKAPQRLQVPPLSYVYLCTYCGKQIRPQDRTSDHYGTTFHHGCAMAAGFLPAPGTIMDPNTGQLAIEIPPPNP